jgi:hypothetical protein
MERFECIKAAIIKHAPRAGNFFIPVFSAQDTPPPAVTICLRRRPEAPILPA